MNAVAAPVPVIEAARLRLRPMPAGDWPACAALMASGRVRHMGGPFDTAAPRQPGAGNAADPVFRDTRGRA